MRKIGMFWRTLTQLTMRQLIFQLIARLRGRPRLRLPTIVPIAHFLTVADADKPVSWQSGTFVFLNKSYSPNAGPIDWNYINEGLGDYGKLWTYNLNYFDFLNQPALNPATGLVLIQDFIAQTASLRDGLEPYPTSLRIMNWVQFLSRNQIQNQAINRHLFAQIDLLSRRLEYHIAGNHLLENGYALLIGSLYFRHRKWLKMATHLIGTELQTQILADGGHDERSPMYHQLLLDRLLTVLLALRHDEWHTELTFVDFLIDKAHKMLIWLNATTFSNGDIPMVNDAAWSIAPTTAQLQAKSERVLGNKHNPPSITELNESGYRMFRRSRYELVADVGPIGPDHQPGHAHADTFSFVLYVDNSPLLMDTGTSTYQPGPRRDIERSTSAHNTVEVNGQNSSEVWAAFRVGWRAKVRVLADTPTELKARHDGYGHIGVVHERAWLLEQTHLIITDRLIRCRDKANLCGMARFHFHPDVQVQVSDDIVITGPVQLSFSSGSKPNLSVTRYNMAEGFNQLRTGQCLEIQFTTSLETRIHFIELSLK
ncbi:alginate lyase family protein [Spirosoma pollinicola]|uniref:Heparinase n=1 Tax=Spirosoma pollinicola TaxID=2057025 RepID=A0A2K8Z6P1_9BACT|nr:alginate lyase family protein [Spirosoma pollinicola]AUD05542.1 heparinase [Spirosoma pollinicola]